MAHFDSLRWDDQKKIEDYCSSLATGGADTKATASQTRADLQVEYSKSNRATCRGCDEKIEMVFGITPSIRYNTNFICGCMSLNVYRMRYGSPIWLNLIRRNMVAQQLPLD